MSARLENLRTMSQCDVIPLLSIPYRQEQVSKYSGNGKLGKSF